MKQLARIKPHTAALHAPTALPPQPGTSLTSTNTTQHINIAFGFIMKVDKSLNEGALRSLIRPGALPVPVGRDGGTHPASGGGMEEGPDMGQMHLSSARYPSPSQTLLH